MKTKFRKFLSILLTGVMLFGALPLCSITAGAVETYTSGDFTLQISQEYNYVRVIGYSGSNTDVVIPENIDGYTITEVRLRNYNKITSLTLPDTVTEIKEGDLTGCKRLKAVYNTEQLTKIGQNAFKNCTSLSYIELSDKLKYIGGYAFSNCTSLPNIYIGKSCKFTGPYAFEKCTNLTSIYSTTRYDLNFYYFNVKGSGFKTIYGYEGTAFEAYAKQNNYEFVALKDDATKGDINTDGNINIEDVTALQKHLIISNPYYEKYLTPIGDIDNDGSLNIKDATALQKYLVGITDKL